jgi:hypothetical protein
MPNTDSTTNPYPADALSLVVAALNTDLAQQVIMICQPPALTVGWTNYPSGPAESFAAMLALRIELSTTIPAGVTFGSQLPADALPS